MNLNKFIDQYGCYTFDEVSFTEIDNVIFSSLSYINFEGLVSSNRYQPVTIQMVGNTICTNYSNYNNDVYAVRKALKIIKTIKDTRRYKDLLLYNYIYEKGDAEQFCAITIEINKKLVYVSYEGTDQLISGWKENFMLSYKFPTISQRRAIDYVNKRFLFRHKNIILGGHSKGGNLALVAGMYANFLVREKIIQIYSNDGPGLLNKQLHSKQYQMIKNKYVHLIPNYSIVGLLLENDSDYQIIKSMKKNVYAHDFMSWVVSDKCFLRADLSSFSKSLDLELSKWLDQYNDSVRERFVLSLFGIFEKAKINSLLDIKEHKLLILDVLKTSRDLDQDIKSMIREFIFIVLNVYKNVSVEEVKLIFKLNKKEKDINE